MTRKKRESKVVAPNIEHYEGRGEPYRVRFSILGVRHDFGYFETYDNALVIRNLLAMRFNKDIVDEETFNDVTDQTLDALSIQYEDALALAESLADSLVATPKQKVGTAQLNAELTAVKLRLDQLERGVAKLLQTL